MNKEEVLKKLLQLAEDWHKKLKEIGAMLNTLDGADREWAIKLVLMPRGVHRASCQIAMRWARGEYGDDRQTTLLLGRVPSNVLAVMPTQTAVKLVTEKVTFEDPADGRVVTKPLSQMSRCDVRSALPQIMGREVVSQQRTRSRPRYLATDCMMERGEVIVTTGQIEVRIQRALLKKLSTLVEKQEVAA